ncbi:MAG: alanine racemase [Rikenellaceae bacterium]|nr:alanine racemase [Rikenellaceae bacterium]
MNYTLSDIARITGGTLDGRDGHARSVFTDSRSVFGDGDSLFFALPGISHNGHDYITELYERGIRLFVIEQPVDTVRFPEAGFVRVANSLAALQQLAADYRNSFTGTVVAVTGSNGKTITKEWIAQLCPPGTRVFRSPKSYNSQLGVALALLMTPADAELVVIEAGISLPGEMARLERMIRPDVGIITNIGAPHQENFESLMHKLSEKLNLFRDTPRIIFAPDEPLTADTVRRRFADRMLCPAPDLADCPTLSFADRASLENASLAVALCDLLGFDPAQTRQRLALLQPVAMRLELKEGINGSKIVDDSYNSDINSLSLALDYLGSIAGQRRRVLILSDIYQSGLDEDALYNKVAALVARAGVDYLIGVGEQIFRHSSKFSCRREFFLRTETLLNSYNFGDLASCAVLIKGSRVFGFERISHALELKTHTTVLEVDLDAMTANLNTYRAMLRPGTRMMVMVKALGYGMGTYEVASLLQHQGVDYLAVAFADEGITLRRAGITMPIVVLNADADSFDAMVAHRLEPEIYSFSSLEAFAATVRRFGEGNFPVHIKIDSGMHRLGFERADIPHLVEQLRGHSREIKVKSIFSHFAASDETGHDPFTAGQFALFDEMSRAICHAFPDHQIVRHICNTAGIERFPQYHLDMVRLGIGLYGVSSGGGVALRTVGTLKSRIVQIKDIPAGDTVGYNRRGVISHDTRTATIPMGYADGLDRHLGYGNWSVLVGGRPAPIVGSVCMDTCMVDITGIDASEGDEVTIFGTAPGNTITDMATVLGTIPYEIITSISGRVKRIYTKG